MSEVRLDCMQAKSVSTVRERSPSQPYASVVCLKTQVLFWTKDIFIRSLIVDERHTSGEKKDMKDLTRCGIASRKRVTVSGQGRKTNKIEHTQGRTVSIVIADLDYRDRLVILRSSWTITMNKLGSTAAVGTRGYVASIRTRIGAATAAIRRGTTTSVAGRSATATMVGENTTTTAVYRDVDTASDMMHPNRVVSVGGGVRVDTYASGRGPEVTAACTGWRGIDLEETKVICPKAGERR